MANPNTLTVSILDREYRINCQADGQQELTSAAKLLDDKMNELANTSESLWDAKTEDFSELVKGWIHNYLTTCSGFMKYSLIAIFHNESRENAKLL